jgi:hypothetical protein
VCWNCAEELTRIVLGPALASTDLPRSRPELVRLIALPLQAVIPSYLDPKLVTAL